MSHHFTLDSLKNISFEQKYKTNIKNKITLPKSIGHFTMENIQINDDIILVKMDQNINKNITFDYNMENIFYINILLEGIHEFKSFEDQKTTTGIKGSTIISFINDDKGINKKMTIRLKV